MRGRYNNNHNRPRRDNNDRPPRQDPLQIPAEEVKNITAWFDSIIRHRVNNRIAQSNIPRNFNPKQIIDRNIQEGLNNLVEIAREAIPQLIDATFDECQNAANPPPPAANPPPPAADGQQAQ